MPPSTLMGVKKLSLVSLLLSLITTAPGCGDDSPPIEPLVDEARSLMHAGEERFYNVFVPGTYDESVPIPLVLDFHGATPDIIQANLAQPAISEMKEVAAREGFIVLHPLGLKNAEGTQTWNSGSCCSDDPLRDDMGFVTSMLDAMEAEFNIDPARIFSTGMSNGGFMSNRLACEMSDRVAAIAPVSGYNGMPTCTPPRAVAVMSFVGDAEGMLPDVVSTTDDWVARNGCDLTPAITYDHGEVVCETWSGCDAGTEVVLCVVEGGGHTWPGGGRLIAEFTGEYQTVDIVASDAMWEFFERHPMP